MGIETNIGTIGRCHRHCPEGGCDRTPQICKESDARSLRGGGGELDNLKTLTYAFTIFAKKQTRTHYLDVQLQPSVASAVPVLAQL
jgi:hypothetical protein